MLEIKNDNALYNLLEEMRARPGMYLGVVSLIRLQAHIYGFLHAYEKYNNEEPQQTVLPLPFRFFHEFAKNYYGATSSVPGWCNLILDNNNKDDEIGLAVFYKLIDIYKNLTVVSCETVEVGERHSKYNTTNKNAPKFSIGNDPKLFPIFLDAKSIFIYELSDNAGYIFAVESVLDFQIGMTIEPKKSKIVKFFDNFFGEKLKWKNIEFNNTLTKKYTCAPIGFSI